MHTRYAPVRHSHSPEGEIPYDLHVLGLPLAFILSQDQTLHCIIVVLFFFPVLGLRYDSLLFLTLETVRASRLTASDLCWPQAFKELPKLAFFTFPLSLFGTAKVQPFFILASFF